MACHRLRLTWSPRRSRKNVRPSVRITRKWRSCHHSCCPLCELQSFTRRLPCPATEAAPLMTRRTTHEPLIFAPTESRTLGLAASERSRIPIAALEEREYAGGEFKLRPLQPVRDRTVFVVQSLAETQKAPIALRLIRLLFLIHGLQDAGAGQVVAVIPYLAYARKDRRTKARDPVYTRYVAQQLEAAGADRVVVLDVHNASSVDNAFRIPVDHLSAMPMMAAHFIQQLPNENLAVASPDIGGIRRAQLFRELLERKTAKDVELVFVEKRRDGEVLSGGTVVGNPKG